MEEAGILTISWRSSKRNLKLVRGVLEQILEVILEFIQPLQQREISQARLRYYQTQRSPACIVNFRILQRNAMLWLTSRKERTALLRMYGRCYLCLKRGKVAKLCENSLIKCVFCSASGLHHSSLCNSDQKSR